MADTFIYDGSTESLEKVIELLDMDTKIVCPECGAELIVILDAEAAQKYRGHPGIYCPVNRLHMDEMIELDDPRERWRKWKAELGLQDSHKKPGA